MLGRIGSEQRRGSSHHRDGLRHRGQLTELQSRLLLLSTSNGNIKDQRNKRWLLSRQLVFAGINVSKNEATFFITLSFTN